MKNLSRRKFLFILIASAGAAAISVERNDMSAENFVITILKAHIPFSELDQSLLRQFAKDLTENTKWETKYIMFMPLYYSKYRHRLLPKKFIFKMQKIEREIVTTFVLHSNAEKYFSGIDQTLIYYGLPMFRLCNPFATIRKACVNS
jgi:hypothetical protein